jgi:nucleoside-diphosphate-sugar epimerase
VAAYGRSSTSPTPPRRPWRRSSTGSRGVYNVVDDDPAPVAEWLPALAQELGAKKPLRVPRFIGRLFAGEAGAVMMTELRGASNAKAKRELGWRPAHPSWRDGFMT